MKFSWLARRVIKQVLDGAQIAEEMEADLELLEYSNMMMFLSDEFRMRARNAMNRLIDEENNHASLES